MSLRRDYHINELFPPRTSPAGLPLCRYCGNALPRGRRAWCTRKCQEEAYIRCYPSDAATVVARRDGGVCADCGADTRRIRRRIQRSRERFGERVYQALLDRYEARGYPSSTARRWWEVHHRIAVADGGGTCGLENLLTLCVPCHKGRHRRRRHKKKTAVSCKEKP